MPKRGRFNEIPPPPAYVELWVSRVGIAGNKIRNKNNKFTLSNERTQTTTDEPTNPPIYPHTNPWRYPRTDLRTHLTTAAAQQDHVLKQYS